MANGSYVIDGLETGTFDLWYEVTGTPSISHTQAHTGYYSMRVNSGSSYVFDGGTANAKISFWIYIATAPSSPARILGNPDTTSYAGVALNSDRTLSLLDAGVVEDTSSETIPLGEWHRICVAHDGDATSKVYLDGTLVCSSTSMSAASYGGRRGCSNAVTTLDLYFDDFYSVESATDTDDLGNVIIGKALPVGEGTDQDTYSNNGNNVNAWTANDVDGSSDAVYTEVDDEPPSTANLGTNSQQNGCDGDNENNWYYTVTFDEVDSGNLSGVLESGDTILSCVFSTSYETEGGGAGDYVFRIRCSDGVYNNTTIDDPAVPTLLIEEHGDTPQGANAWTEAYFNSLEMGYGCTTAAGKGLVFTAAMIQVAILKASGEEPLVYDSIFMGCNF